MRWTLDGAPLDATRCQAAGIDFMEVEIDPFDGSDPVSYTEVECALDRYPLDGVPLGQVLVRVGGMKAMGRRDACLLYYGESRASVGTTAPADPVLVPLSATKGCGP